MAHIYFNSAEFAKKIAIRVGHLWPSSMGWSNWNWYDKNSKPPFSELGIFFDPPNVKSENILTPFKRNLLFWIISKGISQPLSKEMYLPWSRSSTNFYPLTCQPPPYCCIKNDQPLRHSAVPQKLDFPMRNYLSVPCSKFFKIFHPSSCAKLIAWNRILSITRQISWISVNPTKIAREASTMFA